MRSIGGMLDEGTSTHFDPLMMALAKSIMRTVLKVETPRSDSSLLAEPPLLVSSIANFTSLFCLSFSDKSLLSSSLSIFPVTTPTAATY